MYIQSPVRTGFPGTKNPWGRSGLGATRSGTSAVSTLAPAASGATIGTAILPGVGTAIGALLGAGVGLFSGKAHYSPWNFLYDDYPQHIYQNEADIIAIENQIAKYTGQAMQPLPPMYQKTGGPQYQASMQAIVPKYVPGSQGQIASYNRALNESGGAYETTVKMQLALYPQLQAQLQQLQTQPLPPPPPPTQTLAPVQSGSATAPAPYGGPAPTQLVAPGSYAPATPFSTTATPYSAPTVMPQLQPGPSMQPYYPPAAAGSTISVSAPGQAPMQADVLSSLGGLQGMLPYIIGGIGLFVIMMQQSKGGGSHTVYRSRPRARATRRRR